MKAVAEQNCSVHFLNSTERQNKPLGLLGLQILQKGKTSLSVCQPLNGYYLGALFFYNSKNLNCIGALSFFKIYLFTHFHDF